MESMLGKIVKSKCGHDKGELFVIIKIEENYVFLADGKLRLLESPKKKKIKHVELTNYIDEDIKDKIENVLKVANSDIKAALQKYKNKDAKGE